MNVSTGHGFRHTSELGVLKGDVFRESDPGVGWEFMIQCRASECNKSA
jgi:hypothetical protein